MQVEVEEAAENEADGEGEGIEVDSFNAAEEVEEEVIGVEVAEVAEEDTEVTSITRRRVTTIITRFVQHPFQNVV